MIDKKLVILVCLLSSWGTTVYALDVRRVNEYYYVTPVPGLSIYQSIFRSAGAYNKSRSSQSLQLKTMGEYTPEMDFGVQYTTDFFGRCYVSSVDIKLVSRYILPKLSPGYQYSEEILQEFKEEYDKIFKHERVHEVYYINGLADLEKEIIEVGRRKDFCGTVRNKINTLENQTLKHLKRINQIYDCKEYGNELNLEECRR